jgi:hypothetical protein
MRSVKSPFGIDIKPKAKEYFSRSRYVISPRFSKKLSAVSCFSNSIAIKPSP